MTFWSGEKLATEIPRLSLIDKFDPTAIKSASYELCVGSQAFVTRDDLVSGSPTAQLTETLSEKAPKNTIVISPGQFAFLLTEEKVTVPKNALALISMKAKYKFRGLINVSGFHVDPGFSGKLLFSLYNAGPREIILKRGQRMFIIVYASLDRTSKKPYVYEGGSQGQEEIDVGLIQEIATGQVFSPMFLQRQMNSISGDLTEVRIRARLIDGLVVASLGIFFSVTVGIAAALYASDTALATVGGWITAATDAYRKRATEQVKNWQEESKGGQVEQGTSSQGKTKAPPASNTTGK